MVSNRVTLGPKQRKIGGLDTHGGKPQPLSGDQDPHPLGTSTVPTARGPEGVRDRETLEGPGERPLWKSRHTQRTSPVLFTGVRTVEFYETHLGGTKTSRGQGFQFRRRPDVRGTSDAPSKTGEGRGPPGSTEHRWSKDRDGARSVPEKRRHRRVEYSCGRCPDLGEIEVPWSRLE